MYRYMYKRNHPVEYFYADEKLAGMEVLRFNFLKHREFQFDNYWFREAPIRAISGTSLECLQVIIKK